MNSHPAWIHVTGDPTPGPHRTDTDDVLWWLPVLGPTATWLAYLLARHATHQPTTRWHVGTLAATVGLSGTPSKLWSSLERLDRFHAARFLSTDTLAVRLWLPALQQHHLERLPAIMAAAYPTPTR